MPKRECKNFHNNTVIEEIMQVLLITRSTPMPLQHGYCFRSPMFFTIAHYDRRFKEYTPIHCNVYAYLKEKGWDFDKIMKECLHTVIDINGEPTHVVKHYETEDGFVEDVAIPMFALYEVLHRMYFNPKKTKRCKNTNGSR